MNQRSSVKFPRKQEELTRDTPKVRENYDPQQLMEELKNEVLTEEEQLRILQKLIYQTDADIETVLDVPKVAGCGHPDAKPDLCLPVRDGRARGLWPGTADSAVCQLRDPVAQPDHGDGARRGHTAVCVLHALIAQMGVDHEVDLLGACGQRNRPCDALRKDGIHRVPVVDAACAQSASGRICSAQHAAESA
ncbi:hypothetical protein DL89DRAFT_123044 [Linderina pennispora]|uniref:Uncharacterized protein n=1 Tax=Linderina pennispora TaxID=61395 RepID=A0A1Y1WDJ3_9FUNG|nr:uncharacterized protein DL89DRAFT_123044 [Linderina pennispora]ORX71306.1 hypothetical protein DL89DRAFT_123044 [Linderina pennispora]